MDNLRDFLVQKYFIRDGEKYAMEQIASNIINLQPLISCMRSYCWLMGNSG